MSKEKWPGAGPANEVLQDTLGRNEAGILASYALIGAILLLGGLGYGIDRWAGTSPWCLLAGLVAGIVVGLVNLAASLRRS